MQKRNALTSACVQMHHRDFEANVQDLASLTINDLKNVKMEKMNHLSISNEKVCLFQKHVFATSGHVMGSNYLRALYWGQMWGTTLYLNPPSMWMTINPTNIHDPVAQVFAGNKIDMIKFSSLIGPDAD